jgi:hypothetical protein
MTEQAEDVLVTREQRGAISILTMAYRPTACWVRSSSAPSPRR